jgi:hypothetical protein
MLNDWFYSHPTWEVTLAVCATLVILSNLGLLVFHRFVDWEAREHDTSMTGLSYAIAGGIYAVVIAFVAVGVYEAMDKSETIASEEANDLSSLGFDSAGLPEALGERIRLEVDQYIDIVTKREWPRQQANEMDESHFTAGWAQLRKIGEDLAHYEPETPGQATIKSEMLHVANELFSARRARILAANGHLPDAIWQMMLCGLVLVVLYVYLFGPHSLAIHIAVTSLTMISIGLVFSLIIALDYPFRGDLSVDDDAYLVVKETIARIFEAGPAEPSGHEEKQESVSGSTESSN